MTGARRGVQLAEPECKTTRDSDGSSTREAPAMVDRSGLPSRRLTRAPGSGKRSREHTINTTTPAKRGGVLPRAKEKAPASNGAFPYAGY